MMQMSDFKKKEKKTTKNHYPYMDETEWKEKLRKWSFFTHY